MNNARQQKTENPKSRNEETVVFNVDELCDVVSRADRACLWKPA